MLRSDNSVIVTVMRFLYSPTNVSNYVTLLMLPHILTFLV